MSHLTLMNCIYTFLDVEHALQLLMYQASCGTTADLLLQPLEYTVFTCFKT